MQRYGIRGRELLREISSSHLIKVLIYTLSEKSKNLIWNLDWDNITFGLNKKDMKETTSLLSKSFLNDFNPNVSAEIFATLFDINRY